MSMYYSVVNVEPLDDYCLSLEFENHEKKVFDVKPILGLGLFSQLRDPELFKTVRVVYDSIQWANQLDLDPECLYRSSIA